MSTSLSCQIQLTIMGYDWGPSLRLIDLIFDERLKFDNIQIDQMDALIKKQLQITPVIIEKLESYPGTLRLTLQVHPTNSHLSPLIYDPKTKLHRFTSQFEAIISLNQPIETSIGTVDCLKVDEHQSQTYPNLSEIETGYYRFNHSHQLAYAIYDPKPIRPIPLIIWLHGAGEGGNDPNVVLLGNPSFRLKESPIQTAFGSAFVLYPQSPTFWMDDGYGKYTLKGSSFYAKALFGLIDNIVQKTPWIDRDRILIGGNSNGGFMTIRMLLDHPGYFAGAFPICEAFADRWLQETDRNSLKKESIWFNVSNDDNVVDPRLFTLATYESLAKDPEADIHLTLYEKVSDPSGLFQDAHKNPYRYGGHASWIPVLAGLSTARINNQEVSLFSWLASKKRTN
ncbi:MAG: prolyl oligopeptidase family serine peptidase [Candidatus Izemoplasmatales bacterium]|nr:prolyl oligopeptidase family serine peptidase [Candidatus Izemoplasmatales bacterium]